MHKSLNFSTTPAVYYKRFCRSVGKAAVFLLVLLFWCLMDCCSMPVFTLHRTLAWAIQQQQQPWASSSSWMLCSRQPKPWGSVPWELPQGVPRACWEGSTRCSWQPLCPPSTMLTTSWDPWPAALVWAAKAGEEVRHQLYPGVLAAWLCVN